MSEKTKRQALIQELVSKQKVKTQVELVDALKASGFEVTQATVSRDINEMGFVRDGFGYKSAEEKILEDVFHWVKEIKITGNLIIVLTSAGTAQTVALAIDKMKILEVLGSVAGDDTIFLAIEENETEKVTNKLLEYKERAG